MRKELVRHLGEVFVALVIVVFVAVLGSIIGLKLYGRLDRLVPFFAGPTYLFFILAGLGLGYAVNRRQRSRAALWVWILPTIWSVYEVAVDMGSGIYHGESVWDYIWNILICLYRAMGDRCPFFQRCGVLLRGVARDSASAACLIAVSDGTQGRP